MIKIVISGPNFDSGGPLSVMKDLLKEIVKYEIFEVIALVHSKSLYFEKDYEKVTFIEFEDSKSSWFKRIKYEYKEFYALSLQLKPDIWLSMHDITPNVETKLLATYFHNPSPFYKFNFKDFFYDKKFGLFTLFYKYLYRINIYKNDYIFVQQNWIKNELHRMFNLENLIVAKPNIKIDIPNIITNTHYSKYTFFYPSLPRVFKNFEIICQAVEYLINELHENNFQVYITIDGTENQYSYDIVKKYNHFNNIHFIGLISRETVFNYYESSDVLIFPSKLETWGLPISEFEKYQKPLIVSDLPYAKETVGNYDKVNFFNPNNYQELAKLMQQHINQNISFEGNIYEEKSDLIGWHDFVEFLQLQYGEKTK